MHQDYITNHIVCTKEEKTACLETACKVLTLSQTARREGLLALEDQAAEDSFHTPPLIRIGVALITDGTDPDIVEEILENYIVSTPMTNKEFLENILIRTGVLAIQQGENPVCIKEKLCSCFGLDFREAFYDYVDGQPQPEAELAARLNACEDKLSSFPKTPALEFIPGHMEERGLQRLIREISPSTLLYALAGSSLRVITLFSHCMTKNQQTQFWEDIAFLQQPDITVIEKCQQLVRDTVRKLSARREILLLPSDRRILTAEEIEELLGQTDTGQSKA